MGIKNKKGRGWNKRKGVSNNFIDAVRSGELPTSSVSKILKIPESAIRKVFTGMIHHMSCKGKTVSVRFINKSKIKPWLIRKAMIKAEIQRMCKGERMTNEIRKYIKSYTNRLDKNPGRFENLASLALEKWDDESSELKKIYCSEDLDQYLAA